MADDKRIDELAQATELGDDDLFVLQQQGEAKSLPGAVLKKMLGNGAGDEESATSAAESAAAAKVSAEAAAKSAANAETAATTAGGSATEAARYASDADAAKTAAQQALTKAAAAQTAAENAKSAAETAQGKAETAQTAAETAKSDAESAKTAAETAASNAEKSADDAETAATTAKGFASAAATSATNAEAAETSASSAASTAASSASAAKTSATNAKTSETNAASSAYSASDSATAAASSATTAQNAANEAKGYRDEVETKLANGEFDGHTPVKGKDYWTDTDKAEMVNELIEQAAPVSYNAQTLTEAQKAQARENIGAASAEEVDALPNDKTLIANVAEVVKAEVPLVKVAEQPPFVNSVDEMTDTNKVYVMPDGSMWAHKTTKGKRVTPLTSEDFVAANVDTSGVNNTTTTNKIRIATAELLPLTGDVLGINCPSPYQYIVYFYSGNSTSNYLGKTAYKSGGTTNILTETVASGTIAGAKYCRIALRDSTNTSAVLTDRIDEFMSAVSVEFVSAEEVETVAWANTGLTYNQPADYEDRIAALENALEGLEYGTY